MIKIIKTYKDSRILENGNIDTLGLAVENDNKVDILRFQFDDFVDGVAELLTNIEGSDGVLLPFPMQRNVEEKSYDLVITRALLTQPIIQIQLQITNQDYIWHSLITTMTIHDSLDVGTGEMPNIVENWLENADIQLANIQSSEDIRILNENVRIENENKRNNSEEERLKSENERKNNEEERVNYYNKTKEEVENGEFNGATFKPNVDNLGNISWTNDKGLENPQTQNIKGDKGDKGDVGDFYFATFKIQDGYLIANKTQELELIKFNLNKNGELEVII